MQENNVTVAWRNHQNDTLQIAVFLDWNLGKKFMNYELPETNLSTRFIDWILHPLFSMNIKLSVWVS